MTEKNWKNHLSIKNIGIITVLLISYVGVALAVARYLNPGGKDWINTYRPAALAVLSLRSPYTIEIFHSPPWAVFPLIPLALLPERIGFGFNFCLGMISTGYIAYRIGAKPLTVAAILLSYPVLFSNIYGNIDWLVYLGLIMPPRWGLFFILIKPQAGIGLAIYWLVECYREGGFKNIASHFAPITIALLISFALFGWWPATGFTEIGQSFNASLWPQAFPIGLVILVSAIRNRRPGLALASSPFFSPYVAVSSWGSAILGLLPQEIETIVAVIGIWILRLYSGRFLNY